jgi:hypothetical protein
MRVCCCRLSLPKTGDRVCMRLLRRREPEVTVDTGCVQVLRFNCSATICVDVLTLIVVPQFNGKTVIALRSAERSHLPSKIGTVSPSYTVNK